MGIQSTESLVHWNYFSALESDLEKIARYIEFSEDNFSTYSIELAHLYLAAASEVDVILKQLCNLLDPSKNCRSIRDYRGVIQCAGSDVIAEEVYIDRYSMTLTPWVNWSGDSNKHPLWWTAYNEVKHQRNENFGKANLKNVLNAMAGLFVLVVYYYKECHQLIRINDFFRNLDPKSKLFSLDRKYYPTLIDYNSS